MKGIDLVCLRTQWAPYPPWHHNAPCCKIKGQSRRGWLFPYFYWRASSVCPNSIQLVDKLGRGGRPNSSNTRLLPCLGAPLWGLSMLWNSGKRGRGGAPTVQIMPHSKVAEPRNSNMELAPRVLFCSMFEMQTLSICQRQIRRRTYHPFIDMTSLSDLSNIVRRHGTLVQSGHFAGSPKKRFDCGRIPISTSP